MKNMSKLLKMKPINLKHPMVEFGKFAEKLAATQSMSYIIWNIKCVTKEKNINWENNGDNTKGFKFRIN